MHYSEKEKLEIDQSIIRVEQFSERVHKLLDQPLLSKNRFFKPSDVRVVILENLSRFINNIRIELVQLTRPLNFLTSYYKEKITKALIEQYKVIPSRLHINIAGIFSIHLSSVDPHENPIEWNRLQQILIEKINLIPLSYFDNFLQNLLSAFDKQDVNFKAKLKIILDKKIINQIQETELLEYSYFRNAWMHNNGKFTKPLNGKAIAACTLKMAF